MKHTTVDRIFSKLHRDTGFEISESTLIEWIGEALEQINALKTKEEAEHRPARELNKLARVQRV